jgi:segregation and condensation protein B
LEELGKHIEAILFTSDQPVEVTDLLNALNKAHGLDLDSNVVINHLEELLSKYEDSSYPFKIVHAGGGYQFLTKSDYHQTISHFLNMKSRRRLSTAAMETLAIIAYRQPVTKTEIENIRGVNCDYSIQKLLEKELIEITGRADSPGKPLIYGTSKSFTDYFGINSVADLPELKEFETSGDVMGLPPEAQDAMEEFVKIGEDGQAVSPETLAEVEIESEEDISQAATLEDSAEEVPQSEEEALAQQDAEALIKELEESIPESENLSDTDSDEEESEEKDK